MPATPKVSVVLPCYNAHEFLDRALDSVRAQTIQDLEIIIVDDGSTDPDTVAFLDTLPEDIRLIRQQNKGLPGARNSGFAAARGEFVLPLDCDDWIEPIFLERALDVLKNAPGHSFAFSHLALEGEENGSLVKHYNFFEQHFLNHIPYCILVPRVIWERVGGYDESMRQGCEDWEFNLRLGANGFFGAEVSEPLFHYHVSNSGMLQSLSSGIYNQLWAGIQRKHSELFRPSALFKTWHAWKSAPSNRPLIAYFAFLAAYRIFPQYIFARIYRRVLSFSRSRRAVVGAKER
jgi:glycosyltransferase involved in cell wall biosynthesis